MKNTHHGMLYWRHPIEHLVQNRLSLFSSTCFNPKGNGQIIWGLFHVVDSLEMHVNVDSSRKYHACQPNLLFGAENCFRSHQNRNT